MYLGLFCLNIHGTQGRHFDNRMTNHNSNLTFSAEFYGYFNGAVHFVEGYQVFNGTVYFVVGYEVYLVQNF
jgi:flagellar biosynthesis component FlhA